MSRNMVRTLVATIVGTVVVSLVLVAGGGIDSADAGRRRAKHHKKKQKAHKTRVMTAEQQKALDTFMGAFKFGMSKNGVVNVVAKQIRERYAEKVAATNDVYAQDKLRRQRDKEIKRFKKSFIAFKGKKTGWDVSIIDDQFRHRTDEAMMVYWETQEGRDQRRFFFFHDGRLYKMFIALSTSAIAAAEGKGFGFFRDVMESRFGPGKDVNGRVEWRSKKAIAHAINKLGLYGAFCLSLADLQETQSLARIRAERQIAVKKNNILDAIEDDGHEPDISSNSNTIDNLTRD